jgi:ABC-type glycerol-3-phosphate transport system substrate-binding protein
LKFILHLSSFIFLLSACAPTPQAAPMPTVTREATRDAATAAVAAPTSTSATEASVDIASVRGTTVTVWHPWFGVEASLFESQAAEFNSANEWGITVLTVSQNNYTELFSSVTSSLAAPDKPTLVIGLPEHARFWNSQSGVADWTPYVTDPQWGWSADEQADFSSVFLTQDEFDGKQIGLPAQRTARFLFYNRGWARQLGFESPPDTPDDFREQSCAANQSMRKNADARDDGVGGWLVDTDPLTPLAWMQAFDGGALEAGNYRFLTPNNIKAFDFAKKLFDENCAWQSNSTATPFEEFADRRALFVTGSLEDFSALTRALNTVGNADEWEVLLFPGVNEDAFFVYGSSYILLPSSDAEQLAAWLFVRWMLSPERQARWVETTGMFPLRTSTLNFVAGYASTHPQWVAAVRLLPQASLPPQRADWRTVRVALGDGFDFMFRTNLPIGQVATVLAQMDAVVRDVAK